MLNPRPPAAVVAGNVETSQHVVDALYAALGVMANAQGTMNNFTFGDATRQYYETICGGAGATAARAGASAVHTHMTNSRLTDPEILERRFPVRLEAFAVRRAPAAPAPSPAATARCAASASWPPWRRPCSPRAASTRPRAWPAAARAGPGATAFDRGRRRGKGPAGLFFASPFRPATPSRSRPPGAVRAAARATLTQ